MKVIEIFISLLLISNAGFGQWINITPPFPNNNNHVVKFKDENTGWILGDQYSCKRTTDGGKTWKYAPCNATVSIIDFTFFDDTLCYALGSNGTLLISKNAGQSWDSLTSVGDISYAMFFDNPQHGFIGVKGAIIVTNDGGKNWQGIWKADSHPTLVIPQSITFINDTTGFIPMINYYNGLGFILVTHDKGRTWKENYQDTRFFPAKITSFDHRKDKYFVAVNSIINNNKSLIQSYDNGMTWYGTDFLTIDTLGYYIVEKATFLNRDTAFVVIRPNLGGYYYPFRLLNTIDGGRNWKIEYSVHTLTKATDIFFVNDSLGFVIIADRILKTTTFGSLPSAITDNIDGYVFNVVPNPSTGLFTIEYEITENTDVLISVCDISGKIVDKHNETKVRPGHYRLNKHLDLKQGLYIAVITTDNSVNSRRIIIE